MIEQHKSLSEKFLKKWFWLYFFTFLTAPIWYIIKIIISWDLSVEEVWVLYWVISLVTLISSYNDFWLTESLNYFLPKYIVAKDWQKYKSIVFYAFCAQFSTSILLWFLLFFGSDFLAANFFHDNAASSVLKILCLFFLWTNLFQIMSTTYMASQNTKIQKLVDFVRLMFVLWSTLYFWISWVWNVLNYAWTWVIWVGFWVLFSVIHFYNKYYKIYLKWYKILFDKKLFKELFKYAIMALIASNIGTVLSQIDMLLITYILGSKDAWYYTNYLSMITIPFLFITPIFGFLFPVISELNSSWEKHKISTIKTIFYKYFSAFALIVSIFMFIFSRELANVLFGEKFLFSGTILRYSCMFIVFNFLLQINFQILAWIWRVTERAKILWVWLIFNFILNLIFIKLFWVVWSSMAVWISWIPIFVLSYIKTSEYKVNFDFIYLIKNTITSIISWIVVYYLWINLFIWKDRLQSLFLIFILWFFYIIPIIMANFKEIKNFTKELKFVTQK